MAWFDNRIIIFWANVAKKKSMPEYDAYYNGIKVGEIYLISVEKTKINKKVQVKDNWSWVYLSPSIQHTRLQGFLTVYKPYVDKNTDTSWRVKDIVQNLLERDFKNGKIKD